MHILAPGAANISIGHKMQLISGSPRYCVGPVIHRFPRYSIKCVTSGKNGWIDNWKKTNSNPKLWKNSKGKSVKHAEIIAQIDSLQKTKESVELRHVNSHQAEPIDKNSQKYFIWYGNDKADKLAKIGSNLYKRQR